MAKDADCRLINEAHKATIITDANTGHVKYFLVGKVMICEGEIYEIVWLIIMTDP